MLPVKFKKKNKKEANSDLQATVSLFNNIKTVGRYQAMQTGANVGNIKRSIFSQNALNDFREAFRGLDVSGLRGFRGFCRRLKEWSRTRIEFGSTGGGEVRAIAIGQTDHQAFLGVVTQLIHCGFAQNSFQTSKTTVDNFEQQLIPSHLHRGVSGDKD